MTSGSIQHNDGQLYYEMAGEGETVVLCHAAFVDSGMWDSQWQALTQQYRVVRFDMRGFGKSTPISGAAERRQELITVLQHLAIQQATLIGCSLGGEVVLDFAIEYPAMVQKLVLVSAVPGGFEMQGEPPAVLFEMMGAVQAGNLARASELQLQLWVDGSERTPEQVNPQVRQHAATMNRIQLDNGTWLADTEPANPLTPPATTRLDSVTAPTLLIVGALDNSEILRANDVMLAALPDAQKLVIANTAHVPSMEAPEQFNQAVLDFLAR